MKRREFIALLGGAAAVWPLTTRAEQPAMPVVGFIRSTTAADAENLVIAFRRGLREAGFIEGQNVVVEYRWGENQPDRLPALVADLIRRPLAVIVGNITAAQAAKAATTTVPIVFAIGSDPVRAGLVANLNRPGSNVTGVVFFSADLGAKRLEQLRQFVPQATTLAMLANPNTPGPEAERKEVQAAAQAIGQPLLVVDVANEREIAAAFAMFVQSRADALLVGSGPLLNSHREGIVALAARHALPTSYAQRETVVAGGLMSYAPSQPDAYHQAGIYAARILKGEKPGDLPVMRSTKFELVLNLKTAKALGLDVPDKVLALADEVIE